MASAHHVIGRLGVISVDVDCETFHRLARFCCGVVAHVLDSSVIQVVQDSTAGAVCQQRAVLSVNLTVEKVYRIRSELKRQA